MSSVRTPLHSQTFIFFLFFSSSSSSFFFLAFFPAETSSTDTINSSQSLAAGQALVSSNDVFQLGFFTLDNSSWYVGMWYKNIPLKTYVWVANRYSPLKSSSSGVLRIDGVGNLVIENGQGSGSGGSAVWSSNQTAAANPANLVAQLLDTGNLVVREAGDEHNFLWQSFDYPTDTLLPDMNLGWDLKSGLNRYLTSWKSLTDPSTGDYSYKLNIHGVPEGFLYGSQQGMMYRSGPWNGVRFSGIPEMASTQSISFTLIADPNEVYYSYHLDSPGLISRLTLSLLGSLERRTWNPNNMSWSMFWFSPRDRCDDYSECGPYGICDMNASPVCNCTRGFVPKNRQAWSLRDEKDGCVRQTSLGCSTDGFLALKEMKLPDSTNAYVDRTMSLNECWRACSKNCSCTAYSSANISDGGTGCVMWTGELVDMRRYVEGGQDMYVRLAASDVAANGGLTLENGRKRSPGPALIAGVSVAGGFLLLGLTACLVWKRKRCRTMFGGSTRQRGTEERVSQDFLMNEAVITTSKRDYSGESKSDELDVPLFDFNTIAQATDNFSNKNKIGKGGFGYVYKGVLEKGLEIAVKRLSKYSGQGVEEFKNEVRLIVRLQHVNLVRLLGGCVEMDEKMLIYEFMEHGSLDSILFNKLKSPILNWPRRLNIICGIARGLLYLHEDSRFRIIHRDLKASNILLDGELNPKISDFGMARIFGRDQIDANTRRVVGTYGYMSPEYAMDGLFSVKSDVFSFGVLLLEIVSGNKNGGFYYANQELNLLGHAWNLWKQGKVMELLDPSIGPSYSSKEVLRCIQVGLLCVQENAEYRPVMSSVVPTLGSEIATMPQPKNPGFCIGRSAETDSSSSKQDESCTLNQVTITKIHRR